MWLTSPIFKEKLVPIWTQKGFLDELTLCPIINRQHEQNDRHKKI